MPTSTSLAKRIAAARSARGLTQAQLARAAGLDRTAVSKMERGRRRVGSAELERLARALGRPVAWFLAPPPPTLSELRRRRGQLLRVAMARGADNVRVFGSVARGEARPDSDIDLLVRMEPGRTLFDVGGLVMDMRDLLGRDIDVVTEGALRDRVRERVLREAVAL